jgi:hypothetical protein
VETWEERPVRAVLDHLSEGCVLLFIALTMLAILIVAGLVAAYAAFTHRGADVPAVPWVGDALERAVAAVPTLPGDHSRQQQ